MLDIIITGNDESINSNCQYTVKKRINGKNLNGLLQLKTFLHSLKSNWKSQYNLFFMHSLPLSDKFKGVLKDFDVNVIFAPYAEYVKGVGYNRITAYKYAPKESSHSLITDYDVLCFREPELDYSKDFQGGLSGHYLGLDWKSLIEELDLKLDISKYQFNKKPFKDYYNHDIPNLFPFFNNGIVFVNNEFALSISEEIERLVGILIKKSKLTYHYDFQISLSLLVLKHTNNWSFFPKGCNFLSESLPLKEWKDQVSLYHYVGSRKNKDQELIKEYFNV